MREVDLKTYDSHDMFFLKTTELGLSRIELKTMQILHLQHFLYGTWKYLWNNWTQNWWSKGNLNISIFLYTTNTTTFALSSPCEICVENLSKAFYWLDLSCRRVDATLLYGGCNYLQSPSTESWSFFHILLCQWDSNLVTTGISHIYTSINIKCTKSLSMFFLRCLSNSRVSYSSPLPPVYGKRKTLTQINIEQSLISVKHRLLF